MNTKAKSGNWQGRIDEQDGALGLRWHQVVTEFSGQESDLCFLGFCSDEGVSRNQGRVGAAHAPNVLRHAMANFPNLPLALCDAANIEIKSNDLLSARRIQVETLQRILASHTLPLVLGGGHETALGNYLALAKSQKSIGIINIDAHFDLREPINGQSTSGTPFYEAFAHAKSHNIDLGYMCLGIQEFANTEILFRRAQELGVEWISTSDLYNADCSKNIQEFAKKYTSVYLTIDLDVIDSAYAPGVSAVNPMGLAPRKVMELIKCVLATDKVGLVDVVEYNPNFDLDMRTAKVAAQIVWHVAQYKSKK